MKRMRPMWTRAALLGALLLGVVPVQPALAQANTGAAETPEQFADAPHREQTFYFCSACHNFKLVAAQGMSRDRWEETLAWMTVKHNMPKLERDDLEHVLDYLAAAFPPKEPAQPGGWKNPFLN
jgi:hypothetical protein